MFLRNLSDYLQQLISTDGGCLPDTFIQVGADEMPGAFLMAMHDPAGNDNDGVWADFNGAASSEEIPSDGDDDNDGNDMYPENETGMDFDTARPAVEVITQERQAVILGNPGSGKTTLLRQVMRTMARECLQSRLETDIPIYLPLKELSHLETLFGWLETYTAQPRFDCAFAEGRVCLFLDGLNEVQPSEYDTTVRSIRQFLQTFPDCGLIVTSRLYGYAGQLDLPSFLLQDFTDENIRDYICRRTGDDRLFRCIVEHPSLHGQAKNPLLLNMITSIWLDKGDLPDIRLHLYDEFIRYQLRKAGIVSNEDRQTVVDLLSRMAYSMRRFGYLSDSFSGLDKVVADWVEPGRVGEVSRLILASGLLSVSRKAPDFWCISFIHETFQEYFSTLYIYRDYVATKSLCVDFSQPEWGETLKLLAESLSHGGDADRLQDFLRQVAARFANSSGTPYLNDGIGRMFAILSDCSLRCTALREWMGQYLLFHMANFLHLPEGSRNTERFEAIVSSLASLNDPALCLLLFRSYRWMAYWLYTVDELELIGCMHNTPTIQIVAGYLPRFGNKVDIYRAMQDVRNAYGCFESIGVRMKYLQVLLANSMDPEECRALYLAIGDMDALLRTGDLAFIEQETAGKSGLVFPAIVNTLRALDVRNIPYFYRTLFERLDEPGKRSLLDPEVLPDFIMQVPGLDEMILKHPAYAEYRERVLKACYTVPEGYLSHYYFNLIEGLRNEVRTLQVTSGCTIYYRSPEGLCYAKPDMADIHHESSVEFQSVKEACPDAVLRRMQVNEFIIRERLDGPFPVGTQVIEPCYDLQHERIPSLAGNNRINLICASKSNYKHSSNRPYGICIDGMNYLARLYNKQTVGIVMSSLLEGKTLELFKKMSYDRLSYLENYYYFRADWLEEWQIDCVTNTNYATKAKLGVLGRFVEAAINRTGVVVSSEKNRIIVQFRDKLGLRRYPVRFTDFRVGDAVIVYRKLAFKVENWAAFQERAMICGQVVSRNGGNLFISVPDNKYGKDYFYHDPANRFKVGDRVRFFPLLNRVNRFRGNPLATLVEPAEDLGKAPGWQGDFRNFQN